MKRRFFLQSCGAFAVAAASGHAVAEASRQRTLNVQVRVFRRPRAGVWTFIPGALVVLSNGMTAVTSDRPGMRGTAHFPRLPMRRYTARACVNGRWYNATAFRSIRPQDPPWRIDIQLP